MIAAVGGSKDVVLSSFVGCNCLTAHEGDQTGNIDTFFLVVVIALYLFLQLISRFQVSGQKGWLLHGFRNILRHYSSTGNPHFNAKSKTIDL